MTDIQISPRAVPVGALRIPRRYPSVVDGVTVRLVAAAVLVIGLAAIGTHQWWLYAVLAADFIPRAIWGPSRSVLATAVLRFVRGHVPVPPRSTAGAPKRFAAVIGAAMTSVAAAAWVVQLTTGLHAALVVVWVIAAVMVLFPALEAVFGYCVGCKLYGVLARRGWVRPDLCVDCV